ncbi:MAG TPA: APC family permease [Ktedonobacteraceae bacterium]
MQQNKKTFVQRLGFIEVLALSAALMAPTTGVALNTPFIAQSAGFNVPLIFVITTIAILAIGVAFIRLSKQFAHAGSVYGLTKEVLGAPFGLVSGWALLLTYACFITALLGGFGEFAQLFINDITGLQIPWWLYSVLGGVLIWWFAFNDIRFSTRLMLLLELISIVLTVFASIMIIIFSKHTGSTEVKPFVIQTSQIGGMGSALIFGLMTFIGFEGAAILGEEAENSSKSVPRALLLSLIIAGVFFTFVSYAQTLGFGFTPTGVAQFAHSAAPMNDLSSRYIGSWMATVLNGGAVISTFACALASLNGTSHMVFALSRDRFLPAELSRVHQKTQSPRAAVTFSAIVGGILLLIAIPTIQSPSGVYGDLSALATFGVIVAYGMVNIASLAKFTKDDVKQGKIYYLAAPVIGLLLLAYTFYANIYPVPLPPINYFPYVLVVYLLLGTTYSISLRNRLMRRSTVSESAISEDPLATSEDQLQGEVL